MHSLYVAKYSKEIAPFPGGGKLTSSVWQTQAPVSSKKDAPHTGPFHC